MENLNISTQRACNELISANLKLDGSIGLASQTAIANLVAKLKLIFTKKGYSWNNQNLIGVRTNDIFTDAFTDFGIIVIGETLVAFLISTKPGSKYLEHPENPKGTACLAEGNYPAMWQFHNQIGGWTGDPFCQQISRCKVYRQVGKKKGDKIDKSTVEVGLFGINFHTWKNFNSPNVLNLSAGCQVMQEYVMTNGKDDNQLDEVCEYLQKYWPFPNSISYTLLLSEDFK